MARAVSAHVITACPESLASKMTEAAKTRIPTTTHARILDPRPLLKCGLLGKEKGGRLTKRYVNEVAFVKLTGFIDSLTCAPYLIGNVPKMGDIASWGGTSGALIANSWFGVRVNRDGVTANLACAITGRIPYMGLLRPENRRGRILANLDGLDLSNFTGAHYGGLGYYLGEVAGEKSLAINGLPSHISLEKCKYFLSPLSVSGAVGLCLMVGVSPEAPTLEAALKKRKPEETLVVEEKEVKKTWEKLNTATGRNVDLVTLGCPHLTIFEIGELAALLEGKKVHKDVRLIVGASKSVYVLAKEMEYADVIEKAGGIIDDSCIGAVNPFIIFDKGVRTLATNSARAAHYAVRMTKAKAYYGSTESCIDSAVTGKWRGRWK
jgi:predicted aconitase